MTRPSVPDVIVVGAGSAGAVLAARLSEQPDRSVLLLDEGPDLSGDERPDRVGDPDTVPSRATDGRWTRWWDAVLPTGRTVDVCRGRTLGGSSVVNGAYFVRGTREDLAGWAALGNDEWSWERVLPAWCRAERDLDLGDGECHGDEGPLPVGRAGDGELTGVAEAVLVAADAMGVPLVADLNAGGAPGVGRVPRNVEHGRRVDVATAYLDPCRDRPNLEVRAGVRVRSVVIEGGRAVGVEVDAGRAARVLRAGRVVLCAGAVGSAQLLMRSGIGPAEHLLEQGVQVVVDAPGVGRLWDHPAVDVMWRPRPGVLDPDGSPLFQVALHLDSGVDEGRADGDVELLVLNRPYGRANGQHPQDTTLALRVGVQRTTAPGRVRLDSPSPHAPPRIEQSHLAHPDDLTRARHGVRAAVDLLGRPALAALVEERFGPGPEVLRDDGLLDEWLRSAVGTSMHAAGTCAMGPPDDPGAVVDQRGAVRGVDGLWVADTSIMPRLTSRGPAATAVLIGERVAELFRD